MNTNSERFDDADRLWQLLADEATEGLNDADRAELRRLLEANPQVNADELAMTAALVDLALSQTPIEPMPTALANKVRMDAKAFVQNKATPTLEVPRVERRLPWAAFGWVVAATLLIGVASYLWLQQPLTVTQRRADLLAKAKDVETRPWDISKQPGYENVKGDVVWSDARQEGYLRFRGMPSNDPAKAQFQLWIVDPTRDKHPVDGGVFDIPAGAEEVIIPINAKLQVRNPVVFAITREQPGGVVVSGGPLLVLSGKG